MKQLFAMFTVVAVGASMAGCARITTQVVDKPRVDQELNSGNRGYFQGRAPEPANRKMTRQVIETDIEMATSSELTPWKKKKAQSMSEMQMAPVRHATVEPAASAPATNWQDEQPG